MASKRKGLNNQHTLKAVALAVTAMVMFSCQKEQVQDSRVTLLPVIERKIETAVHTRAINSANYDEYVDDANSTRQALAVQAISFYPNSTTRANNHPEGNKDAAGTFVPLQSGGWRSGVKVELGFNYDLYVYSRTMPSSTDPTFTYDGSNTKLSFNGLHLLSATDPLVCIAASGATLPDNPDPSTYPSLQEGSFNIGNIEETTVENVKSTTKAFLAMDHLYSKATLSFKIDDAYSQLRTIRIKDVQVTTTYGTLTGTHNYTFANNKLTLPTESNISVSGSPITINLFEGPNAVIEPDAGKDYYTLTTTSTTFGYFYFLPINPLQTISLSVTYDVCDLAGNVTRANQTATNNNLFAGMANTESGKAERGYNYTINVTVSPTYLYVLSDDDVVLDLTIE